MAHTYADLVASTAASTENHLAFEHKALVTMLRALSELAAHEAAQLEKAGPGKPNYYLMNYVQKATQIATMAVQCQERTEALNGLRAIQELVEQGEG